MRSNSAILVLGGLAVVLMAAVAGIWLVLEGRQQSALPEQLETAHTEDPDPQESIVTAEKIESMQRSLQPDGILDMCIQRYYMRLGRYPSSLEDLLTEPEHLRPGERWDGPYIHNARILNDAWSRRYEYRSPGVYNPETYDIWSRGLDGISGTEDDLGNW